MTKKKILFRFLLLLVVGTILNACAHEGPTITDGLASEAESSGDLSLDSAVDQGSAEAAKAVVASSNTSEEASVKEGTNLDAELNQSESVAFNDSASNSETGQSSSSSSSPNTAEAAATSLAKDTTSLQAEPSAPLLDEASRTTASTDGLSPDTSFTIDDPSAAPVETRATVTPSTKKIRKTHAAAALHSELSKEAEEKADVPLSEIPSKPVEKNGKLLNRYYFLRHADTPESVSNRLYGSPASAAELTAWNEGVSWVSGNWILYTAAINAQDSEMHSYFEDQKMEPEMVIARPGDSLPLLAQLHYGDRESWKEIALLNNMRKQSDLKTGMQIKLFPSKLPELAKIEAPAVLPGIPSTTAALLATAPAAAPVNSSPIPDGSSSNPANPAETRANPDTKPVLADTEVGSGFFQEHPEAFAGGIALASLGLFALFFYRRRKAKRDPLDFTE